MTQTGWKKEMHEAISVGSSTDYDDRKLEKFVDSLLSKARKDLLQEVIEEMDGIKRPHHGSNLDLPFETLIHNSAINEAIYLLQARLSE